MKKVLCKITVSVIIGQALCGTVFAAGTASTTLAVSAIVANNCTISSGIMNFNNYDPVVTNAAADLLVTQANAFSVACTKGAVTTIGADVGANAAGAVGTTRAMTNGTNFLSYELYVDISRTNIWQTTGASNLINYTSTGKAAASQTIYGKVVAGQDVAAGSYTDSVVMTINF